MWSSFSHFDVEKCRAKKVQVDERDGSFTYVCADDVLDLLSNTHRAVAVRSCPGSGKTEVAAKLCSAFAAQHACGTILFVTPRVTLAESVAARLIAATGLPFRLYNEKNLHREPSVADARYVVTQVESVHRFAAQLAGDGDEPCLLVIDEFVALLTQISSTFTHGGSSSDLGDARGFVSTAPDGAVGNAVAENAAAASAENAADDLASTRESVRLGVQRHAKNVSLLFAAMRAEKNRIALFDAFLSDFSVDVVCTLVPPENVRVVVYDRPADHRVLVRVPLPQSARSSAQRAAPFVKMVVKLLAEGRNIYVYSSSKKMVKTLGDAIRARFDDSVPFFVATGDEVTAPLADVDYEWSRVRAVITTSKVTVGVNYDRAAQFDCVVCYVAATCRNRVRDVYQSMFRVRNPQSPNVFLAVDTFLHPDSAGDLCGTSADDARELIDHTASVEPGLAPPDAPARARSMHLFRIHHLLAVLAPDDAERMRRVFARDEHEVALSALFTNPGISAFADACGFDEGDEEWPSSSAHSSAHSSPETKQGKITTGSIPPWALSTPLAKRPRKK